MRKPAPIGPMSSKCLLKIQYLAILHDYEPILPLNGEWGGEREVWIVGVPTVTLWSSGVHIWSNIPHNKCIDAFEHSQYYMRLVCACKATLFPLNVWGKEEENACSPVYDEFPLIVAYFPPILRSDDTPIVVIG